MELSSDGFILVSRRSQKSGGVSIFKCVEILKQVVMVSILVRQLRYSIKV